MVVVGFDVAKNKLDGVVFNQNQAVSLPWCIPNNPKAITEKLEQLVLEYGELRVTFESTGNYHLLLMDVCHRLRIQAYILNPIVTKQQTRSTVRKTKTDTLDAAIIARLGCMGEGTPCTPMQFESARQSVRVAVRLTKQATVYKQLIHSTNLIPEAKRPVQVLELLNELLARQEEIINTLYQVATSALNPDTLRLLQSVPGMGPKTATTVLAEVDNVERFTNAKSLVAYAGLDPVIRQSGHGPIHYGKLTKRGSVPLRRALFLAANAARRSDPELKRSYEAKRAEGKPHAVATIHIARRLVYRLFAILRERRPYEMPKENE